MHHIYKMETQFLKLEKHHPGTGEIPVSRYTQSSEEAISLQ